MVYRQERQTYTHIYIYIYINMNMLKRLQDSLKSGKNDPFPSPFNTSAFSNSSSSILNINRLSPRTAKRKGKNKQHDGDNNEEEEESDDDEDGGRICGL